MSALSPPADLAVGLQAQRRIDKGRVLMVPLSVGLLLAAAMNLVFQFQKVTGAGPLGMGRVLVGALVIAFYALIVATYLVRGPARATTPSLSAQAAALLATWLPFVLPWLRQPTARLPIIAASIVLTCAGLAWSV